MYSQGWRTMWQTVDTYTVSLPQDLAQCAVAPGAARNFSSPPCCRPRAWGGWHKVADREGFCRGLWVESVLVTLSLGLNSHPLYLVWGWLLGFKPYHVTEALWATQGPEADEDRARSRLGPAKVWRGIRGRPYYLFGQYPLVPFRSWGS